STPTPLPTGTGRLASVKTQPLRFSIASAAPARYYALIKYGHDLVYAGNQWHDLDEGFAIGFTWGDNGSYTLTINNFSFTAGPNGFGISFKGIGLSTSVFSCFSG